MKNTNYSRRKFISDGSAFAASALVFSSSEVLAQTPGNVKIAGQSVWPSEASWQQLKEAVDGRLIKPIAPWSSLKAGEMNEDLKNPWYLEEQAGATQSTGMYQAWDSTPSAYAVAVEKVQDIVAAVNFARQNKIRLAVKGTGHDYFGRSCAPDSLLVWTHPYRGVTHHPRFFPQGAPPTTEPVQAVSVRAGNRWLEAYQVATAANCYVQGGGCTSVGACGGFALGGGFGSYSKKFGSGAAGVLELEVVVADGRVLIANAHQNEDLFWALRGGGGGTFGIVSRITLLAHPMPKTDGWISGTISASSDAAYLELIHRYVSFVPAALNNGSWGEGVIFPKGKNHLEVGTAFLDLTVEQAQQVWNEFTAPLKGRPKEFSVDLKFSVVPFKEKWNPKSDGVIMDSRPGAPAGYFWWKGNDVEVGAYWANYQGRGVPLKSMSIEHSKVLAKAIFDASRTSLILFQTNKGLAGEPQEARAREITTSLNPVVFNNVGFFTLGSWVQYKYPKVPGHEPDMLWAKKEADAVNQAMVHIKKATPDGGSYTNEGDFSEKNWQSEFWGIHYARLLSIKRKYDPDNLFRVHHGVGSESQNVDSTAKVTTQKLNSR